MKRRKWLTKTSIQAIKQRLKNTNKNREVIKRTGNRKAEASTPKQIDGNKNQAFYSHEPRRAVLSAVGVRCLFCDRPANRISNDLAVAKPRKSDMRRKLRRPQTAREKMDRQIIHYGTNRRKNHAVNIKVMDGVVAPPSPARHSFRVSALVPNPSKQHTNQTPEETNQ